MVYKDIFLCINKNRSVENCNNVERMDRNTFDKRCEYSGELKSKAVRNIVLTSISEVHSQLQSEKV